MRIIDKDFLMDIVSKLLSIGEEDGYVKREAFTREALMAESFVIARMQDIGLDVRRDEVGNIFARRRGSNNKLPTVAAGSHIDTCLSGAMHESAVGIAVILAAMEALQYEECLHPLEVIVFSASEYSRFGMSRIGSRVMTDENTSKYLVEAESHGYSSFFSAISAFGHDARHSSSVLVPKDRYKSFIEVYAARRDDSYLGKLGLVRTVGARTRLRVVVSGDAVYGTNSPKGKQHDVVLAASKLMIGLDELVRGSAQGGLHICIGGLTAEPNAIGAIARRVEFYADIAGYDDRMVMNMLVSVSDLVDSIVKTSTVAVVIDAVDIQKPVSMAGDVAGVLESKLRKNEGESYMVYSTETHDGGFMSKVTPSAMLEVPFIMYGSREHVAVDALVLAAEVLADSMLEMSGLLWKSGSEHYMKING